MRDKMQRIWSVIFVSYMKVVANPKSCQKQVFKSTVGSENQTPKKWKDPKNVHEFSLWMPATWNLVQFFNASENWTFLDRYSSKHSKTVHTFTIPEWTRLVYGSHCNALSLSFVDHSSIFKAIFKENRLRIHSNKNFTRVLWFANRYKYCMQMFFWGVYWHDHT